MSVQTTISRPLSRTLPGATVLQILPALTNEPSARTAVNVASALLRSGARAIVASEGGRFVGELQALGGEWMHVQTNTLNPLTLKSNTRRFSELIDSERVDIVHAYSGATAFSARAAIRSTGAWLVTTYAGAPPARVMAGFHHQGALARGDKILADSNYAADLIVQRYTVPAERVVTIRRGVDVERFHPAVVSVERIAVLRHGWRINPGVRVILVPGSIAPDKGQMTVVDAARILANGGVRGVAFVIAGEEGQDGDFGDELNARIKAQGLVGLVRRLGHCSDMPAAYALADMIVVPAIEPRTSSQVVAEVLAMARPVIASAVGVLPEIVQAPPSVAEEDRLGWLVPPSDPLELAKAIATVLALEPSLRQALRARARYFAELNFSPVRVAAATLSVYTSLLEGER